MNNTQINNGEDIDILMPIYNIIESSDNIKKHLEVHSNTVKINLQ